MSVKSIQRSLNCRRGFSLLIKTFALVLLFSVISLPAWQVCARAIWTTDSTGVVQDGNIYHDRCAVFINGSGWPAKTTLYIRVTRTNGGSLNYGGPPIVVSDENGEFGPTGPLCPYDLSPNGEYKAWVSLHSDFKQDSGTKTDNFRVKTVCDLTISVLDELIDVRVTQAWLDEHADYGGFPSEPIMIDLGDFGVEIVSCADFDALMHFEAKLNGVSVSFDLSPLVLTINGVPVAVVPGNWELPLSLVYMGWFTGHNNAPGEIVWFDLHVNLQLLGNLAAGDEICFTVVVEVENATQI